jgi:hypothetical protein
MKKTKITLREELSDQETEEIASVLEGARLSNRINVDRAELKEHLNNVLAKAGLIHSSESDDEDLAFEEAFAKFAGEPESAPELRNQYEELADLADRLERMLRRDDLAPALAARLRWLTTRQPQRVWNTTFSKDRVSGVQLLHDVRNATSFLKLASKDLANFYASQITTGRPRDGLLDILIMDLAEVYLAFRPDKGQIANLSESPKSIFLRFCSDVLQHFISDKSTYPGTLAHRWKRLRKNLHDA